MVTLGIVLEFKTVLKSLHTNVLSESSEQLAFQTTPK